MSLHALFVELPPPASAPPLEPRKQDLFWLFYLSFLFLPVVVLPRGDWRWLWPTLAAMLLFLPLYLRAVLWRRVDLPSILGIALICYLLTPFNPAAFTILIYAAALAPLAMRRLAPALLLTLGLLAVLAVEILLVVHQAPLDLAVAVVLCVMCAMVNFMAAEARRKNVALALSREEIRRLAAVAERERIARDLHDLLGHTLSLIALKSELAGKLIGRDRDAAAREIADVTRVSREALGQVRSAVTGMRTARLRAELDSARALLESSGIELTSELDAAGLSADAESALALIIREAATNIQRHAGASRAYIEMAVSREPPGAGLTLVVRDDGRGGARTWGNGLTGIAERVRALGGSLEVQSPLGEGTVLRASLPLAAEQA